MTAALALPAECLRAAMNCGADQLAAVLWSAVNGIAQSPSRRGAGSKTSIKLGCASGPLAPSTRRVNPMRSTPLGPFVDGEMPHSSLSTTLKRTQVTISAATESSPNP
jgi:hypothetical protein